MRKLQRQAAKQLMRMDIYPDSDGFLYYNELLFYFFRDIMKDHIEFDGRTLNEKQ